MKSCNVVAAITAAAAAAILIAPGSAQATELLVNGGFEAPAIGAGNYTYPGLSYGNITPLASPTQDGWTYLGAALGGGGSYNPWYYNTPPTGGDGSNQFVALQGTSTLAQTFTMVGTVLDVSWLAAGRPGNGNNDGNQSYDVTLGALTSAEFFTSNNQGFVSESAHFSGLTSGAQYTLTFVGLDTNPNGTYSTDQTAFIDHVSAIGSGAVPEPAAWALMIGGFGLAGAALRRRRAVAAA